MVVEQNKDIGKYYIGKAVCNTLYWQMRLYTETSNTLLENDLDSDFPSTINLHTDCERGIIYVVCYFPTSFSLYFILSGRMCNTQRRQFHFAIMAYIFSILICTPHYFQNESLHRKFFRY